MNRLSVEHPARGRARALRLACACALACMLAMPSAADGQPASRTPLQRAIDRELSGPRFTRTLVAVDVSDPASGAVVYSRNADLLLRPASNTKLFTSAAALQVLPASFAFETAVFADGPDSAADVWIRGSGDPLLDTEDIQKIAEIVRTRGIRTCASLRLDGSVFDTLATGSGWMYDDETDATTPWISAFPVNRNRFTAHASAPPQPGTPLRVSVDLPNAGIAIVNTAVSGDGRAFSLRRETGSNTLRLDGALHPGGSHAERFALWDPPAAFLLSLRAALERAGVSVAGVVRASAPVPSGARPLGVVRHALDDVLTVMNHSSDNTCAESLLKAIAHARTGGPGSAADGAAVRAAALHAMGIDTAAFRLVDGSGLSFYNLAGAGVIGSLLRACARAPWFDRFLASLAAPAAEGTMKKRLTGGRGAAWVHAKTGSLRGVSALSGYVLRPGGPQYAFSILVQNFTGDDASWKSTEDAIVRVLLDPSLARPDATSPR